MWNPFRFVTLRAFFNPAPPIPAKSEVEYPIWMIVSLALLVIVVVGSLIREVFIKKPDSVDASRSSPAESILDNDRIMDTFREGVADMKNTLVSYDRNLRQLAQLETRMSGVVQGIHLFGLTTRDIDDFRDGIANVRNLVVSYNTNMHRLENRISTLVDNLYIYGMNRGDLDNEILQSRIDRKLDFMERGAVTVERILEGYFITFNQWKNELQGISNSNTRIPNILSKLYRRLDEYTDKWNEQVERYKSKLSMLKSRQNRLAHTALGSCIHDAISMVADVRRDFGDARSFYNDIKIDIENVLARDSNYRRSHVRIKPEPGAVTPVLSVTAPRRHDSTITNCSQVVSSSSEPSVTGPSSTHENETPELDPSQQEEEVEQPPADNASVPTSPTLSDGQPPEDSSASVPTSPMSDSVSDSIPPPRKSFDFRN